MWSGAPCGSDTGRFLQEKGLRGGAAERLEVPQTSLPRKGPHPAPHHSCLYSHRKFLQKTYLCKPLRVPSSLFLPPPFLSLLVKIHQGYS